VSGKLALGARGYLVGGLLVLAVAMASFAPARQAGAQFLRLFRVQNVAVIPFEPEAALLRIWLRQRRRAGNRSCSRATCRTGSRRWRWR
jgi:hypothetical protein